MENTRWTQDLELRPKYKYRTKNGNLDLYYKTGVKINEVRGWKPVECTLNEYTSLLSSILDFSGFETREGKKDVVGVMYSGGRSSTYLILNSLLEGKYVLPIYCVNNIDLEEIIWIKNLQLLQEEYGHILKPVRIDISYCFGIGDNWKNGHITRVFQNFIPYYLNSKFYGILSEIQFGYSDQDEYTNKLEDFAVLRKSLERITEVKIPKLSFPLLYLDKSFVDRRLSMYGDNLCYSCPNLNTKCVVNKKKKWVLFGIEECGSNECTHCKLNSESSILPRNIVVGLSYGLLPISEDNLIKYGVIS